MIIIIICYHHNSSCDRRDDVGDPVPDTDLGPNRVMTVIMIIIIAGIITVSRMITIIT